MGLKKVVIAVCLLACVAILLPFNNFPICLLSSAIKAPGTAGSHIRLPCVTFLHI